MHNCEHTNLICNRYWGAIEEQSTNEITGTFQMLLSHENTARNNSFSLLYGK